PSPNTTTIASLAKIKAVTQPLHFPAHRRVGSQESPDKQIGAATIITYNSMFLAASARPMTKTDKSSRTVRMMMMTAHTRMPPAGTSHFWIGPATTPSLSSEFPTAVPTATTESMMESTNSS